VHPGYPHLDRGLLTAVGAVGLAGGLVGVAYVSALRVLEDVVGHDRFAGAGQVGVLVAVGIGIGLLVRVLGDPGDVELLVDNIHVEGGSRDTRALRSLLPASLLGIAAGSALGPEAPLVQTGGVLGTTLAERRGFDREQTRVLAICGMASAFAVLFGAPLGSAVFALEILHRRGLEYYEALLPALGGAFVGFAVFTVVEGVGHEPLIVLPTPVPSGNVDLLWGGLAAVVGAGLALAFSHAVELLRRVARRVPAVGRPAVGGLALGLLSLWSFAALTFGEAQITELADADLAVPALLAAVAAKLLGSAVCLTTGWRGGFIIPLFFAGAAAGQALHHLVPSADPTLLMAACMVATNVGVTKTPVGSTLVVARMAGLQLLPSTTLAALGSLLLTGSVNLIGSQRTRTPTGGGR